MTTYSRIPTSPTAPAFKSLLEKLDYKAIDEELNKVIAVTSPGNPYEIKLHLMRYDFQFNQDYLDRYTELYGGRWANGEERLELGMTPEESYIHWDKTMNFALRNGAVVIVLWRIKGTNDEWKFGIGSHCFDMADMTLPDYQALHPPSYQPWADVFDKLFVDYRKDDLVHGRYFYNNSTCRVDELKVNGMTVATHVYSIVGGSLGMIGCHVIVLSTKLQGKIYKPIEKESHVVRVVEFTEVYDCKPEQKALLAIRATNIYFKREEMEALRYKIVRAYDKMQEKARRAQL